MSQLSFLMKIMCFYNDFAGFWTDFGGFRWILNGFWSLGPLLGPKMQKISKKNNKIENFWGKIHQKVLKNMRFGGKFWNFWVLTAKIEKIWFCTGPYSGPWETSENNLANFRGPKGPKINENQWKSMKIKENQRKYVEIRVPSCS